MPRNMDESDWKCRTLMLALLEAQSDFRGVLEHDVHSMTPRFLREVKKLNIEYPDFYPNIVNKYYPEVHDAITFAISCEYLIPRMTSGRMTRRGGFIAYLDAQTDFTTEEMRRIQEAARLTVQKFRANKLDDDLKTKTAAQP